MSSTESKTHLPMTASDLPEQLAAALRGGRTSGRARVRMSPEMSYGRHAGPAPQTARRAAVMILLFQRAGRWHIPLTERTPTLTHHGGQISLPGGAIDPGETSCQAALRELDEELGVGEPVDILGQLAECYVFASDFLITPWVAALRSEPLWRPHDREVQGVVELPLEALLDERTVDQMTIQRGPLVFQAPCIRVGSASVWGATSVILNELGDVLCNLKM